MRTCFASRRNKRGLRINEETALLSQWQLRFKFGLHQASAWGHVSRREGELWQLPEGCRISLRGYGGGGKRRRGDRSLAAAALSVIDAGVALRVLAVGVALLLCFYSGRRDIYNMCIFCLCFTRAFTFGIGRVPSINNILSVSIMTIDCWQCRVYFLLKRQILFNGSSSFSFRTMRIAEGRCLFFFHFRLQLQLPKKIGADSLVSSFRMYYYCTKNK